jgi:hypothetical protein
MFEIPVWLALGYHRWKPAYIGAPLAYDLIQVLNCISYENAGSRVSKGSSLL